MRGLLLYNLKARRLKPDDLQQMRLRLADLELSVRVAAVGSAEAVPRNGESFVLVAGGDGTVHRLLADLLLWRLPVGLLPCGTADCLAAELGLPRHWKEASRIIARGATRRVWIPRGDGRPFLLMTGIGLDAWILSRIGEEVKRRLGVAGFWLWGAVQFLRCPLIPIRVASGDEEWEAPLVIVANASRYGRDLLVAPEASVSEASLDICAFTSVRRRRYPVYLWAALRGRHPTLPDVVYRKVSKVGVCTPVEGILAQMDGELLDRVVGRLASGCENLCFFAPELHRVADLRDG